MPSERDEAIKIHVDWSDRQLCKYRMDWCKKWQWLVRAKEFDVEEVTLETEANSCGGDDEIKARAADKGDSARHWLQRYQVLGSS